MLICPSFPAPPGDLSIARGVRFKAGEQIIRIRRCHLVDAEPFLAKVLQGGADQVHGIVDDEKSVV